MTKYSMIIMIHNNLFIINMIMIIAFSGIDYSFSTLAFEGFFGYCGDDFHHLGLDTRFICNHKLQHRRLLIEGEMCHIIINTENVNKILMHLNLFGLNVHVIF